MTSAHPETFRCIPLGCTLSRESCGARHQAARSGPRPSAVPRMSLIGAKGTCGTCEVGAAHARGERPDVTIASVVARETETKTEVVEMPNAKRYEHDGQSLTIKEWRGKLPVGAGLTDSAITMRITSGWSVVDAFCTPKGAQRPSSTTQAKREKRASSPTPREAATTAKAATLDEHIAKRRAFITERRADAHVTEIGSAEHAASVLKRLGYVVEDAGIVPAGRLILVRTPHAPQVSL